MHLRTLSPIFICAALTCACEESPTDSNGDGNAFVPVYSADLIGYYSNPGGTAPQFVIDADSTDESITYDAVPRLALDINNLSVSITLTMISVADDTSNYRVDSVVVREFRNGDWVWDSEFSVLKPILLSKIAVVLVLDVSSSLGGDFYRVKEYAKEFVQIIKNNTAEAYIGIVDFATEIHSLQFTTNIDELLQYIDALQQGEYTKMYDALDLGIDMLEGFVDVQGKSVVTFTDGRDNYSTRTPDYLLSRLANARIASYTMGLQGRGGVEDAILRDLAVNGRYVLVTSMDTLRKAFRFFARSVSYVYTVTYLRNNQSITDQRPLKFTFMQMYDY